jgi:hypothetical protein
MRIFALLLWRLYACVDTPHVTLKDYVFIPSLPLRHVSELIHVWKNNDKDDAAALLMCTDGGPDQNCKHLTV